MTAQDFIENYPWFAIIPVKTVDEGWKWLVWLRKEVNYLDEFCFGLPPKVRYYTIKETEV